MEVYIKLSSQTAGKDKLARLFQYASKCLAYLVAQLKLGRVDLADQLKHLEFHFGTFRKLLRLGKSVEILYGALKNLHLPDTILRSLITLSKIAQSFFLLADHIIWVGRVGLLKINNEKWSNLANRCWLYSITLNLLRDFYEITLSMKQDSGTISRIPSHVQVLGESKGYSKIVPPYLQTLLPYVSHALSYCRDHKDVAIDTAKNICDIFIPLSSQGHVKLNPGIVGALGVISSALGMIALIDPMAKLSP